MTAANFDPVARVYRWLEYFSFGPALERSRFHFLPQLAACRRALILGDGDGRFTARLLASNHDITVTAVDSSREMLRLLHRRICALGIAAETRLTLHHADALQFTSDITVYDLVVTHFFLDCFSDDQVGQLVRQVLPGIAPGAVWIVSEFAIPQRQPVALLSRILIGLLYRGFGLLTGLRVRRLPDHAAPLRQNGFIRRAQKFWLGGLLISESWALQSALAGNHDGCPSLPQR